MTLQHDLIDVDHNNHSIFNTIWSVFSEGIVPSESVSRIVSFKDLAAVNLFNVGAGFYKKIDNIDTYTIPYPGLNHNESVIFENPIILTPDCIGLLFCIPINTDNIDKESYLNMIDNAYREALICSLPEGTATESVQKLSENITTYSYSYEKEGSFCSRTVYIDNQVYIESSYVVTSTINYEDNISELKRDFVQNGGILHIGISDYEPVTMSKQCIEDLLKTSFKKIDL